MASFACSLVTGFFLLGIALLIAMAIHRAQAEHKIITSFHDSVRVSVPIPPKRPVEWR